jgi:3-vinyl bacteriochlorophyllide hydratase
MIEDRGFFRWIDAVDGAPWGAVAGRHVEQAELLRRSKPNAPLYTLQQRARRDQSGWTLVQGILAPVQFLIFLVSLALVLRYVFTGQGLALASLSVVVKTVALYTIMVTGAVWENAVFGQFLFAPAFFWEDVFSMLVLALHSLYVAALVTASLAPHALMLLALAAYASYVINAGQFVFKLRQARLDTARYAA